MEKEKMRNVIMVGGSHRNSGKTELICNLIKRFRGISPVICLKVCTHDTNDPHDEKANDMVDDYWLIKEEPDGSTKSTDRMFAAGAAEVYRLITSKNLLEEGFQDFLDEVKPDKPVLIESNSLREIIEPELFLFVNKHTDEKEKLSSKRTKDKADYTFTNKDEVFRPDLESIPLPVQFVN